MAKPRSNAAAVEYWAQSICEREPRPDIDVNSIMVRSDVVYSFGRHYPMGVIERRPNGTVKRVVLNSDHYPCRGWANTPGDQWATGSCAREYAAKARVPVVEQPLTAFRSGGSIRCRPKPEDPEPEAFPRIEVPLYFAAHHPGEEPVHDRTNCIAGRTEEYEYQSDDYFTSNLELYADDQNYVRANEYTLRTVKAGTWLYRKSHGSIYSRRMHVGMIVWGEEQHDFQHEWGPDGKPANLTYKQCPCCYAHMTAHRRWHVYMHGGYELGPGGWKKGWVQHEHFMRKYGSEQAWREARREDLRRVRRARKTRAEWEDRNFMPLDRVPRGTVPGSDNRVIRTPIPVLDSDGYPLRKDSEAHFKAKRERERQERRRERERERLHREHIQIEKFKARIERIRAEKHARSFEGAAANVATILASLTNGRESSHD